MQTQTLELENLLLDLRHGLEELYGSRLQQIILFGSEARGDAHADSDVDIALVLKDPIQMGPETERLGPLLSELNLRYERLVAIVPISTADYSQAKGPFWSNVRREGLVL